MTDQIIAKAFGSLDRGSLSKSIEWADHCIKAAASSVGPDAIVYNRAGVVASVSVALHYLDKIIKYWQRGSDDPGNPMYSWSLPFVGMRADIELATRAYIENPDQWDKLAYSLEYAYNTICTTADGYRIKRDPVSGQLREYGSAHYETFEDDFRTYAQLAFSGLKVIA